MSDLIVKLPGVSAPQPFMHRDAAAVFQKLRNVIAAEAGFDFLAKCGDIKRDATFRSSKDGVANRSWHKTGRAVDYDQTSKFIVIVSEPKGGKQYFRTYLKCSQKPGQKPLGTKLRVKDIRGFVVDDYLVDFTAKAESLGFKRIPAWNGWQKNYNRREFWHYQYNPANLTWDAAMLELRGKTRPAAEKVLGLNDRGDAVREVQAKLAAKGLLPQKEVDGVYGAKTKAAVEKFQRANKLNVDGLVGPQTRAKLFS
jgi:hypothetical protein